ncbi:stage V sporulation protein AA [Oceanobacillus limi]|uniref:Stage V sporulation protein AA n=1 Tax=Oceanobacillus limi TaxID=930131 RepID=A0A1H9ZKQ5_9BACI|nr:stage V sporulation protein AA [Oceanobacillus limi]SES81701.1 stage V sporulation protein AA [Oceanobacillus limi]
MAEIVYLRMKKNLELDRMQELQLKDIAFLTTQYNAKKNLESMRIYRITEKDQDLVVIDSFLIIEHLNKVYPNLEIQVIGPTHTIVRIHKRRKLPSTIMSSFVWILLFIGTAMTIMNFHYDVSMQEVQQKLHYLLTGEENDYPLWIQIPYSIGLGLGMLLFFNHWFNKRFNEEPSPLEVEIFNYQQALDNYISHHENKLNDTDHSG